MTDKRQTVRTFIPSRVDGFDQQFWPIFMALCVTSTMLAATIVTLLSGFWMWASLMILPAAFAVMVFILRFVDSRSIQRSLQLGLILSLALHCCFIIYAQQTKIFSGFFLEIDRATTAVRQPRMMHVSKQVKQQPWMETNELPTPKPEEQPETRKQSTVDTSTARPQPTPIRSNQSAKNPQLVRRQQTSRTVPRLGENLSKLSRQSANVQPKSSEKVPLAKPSPTTESDSASSARESIAEPNRPSKTKRPSESGPIAQAEMLHRASSTKLSEPTESKLTRQQTASEISRPDSRPKPKLSQSKSNIARSTNSARPKSSTAIPKNSVARSSSQSSPTTVPSGVVTKPTTTTPKSSRSRSSEIAKLERQAPRKSAPNQNVRPSSNPTANQTPQLAQRRRRDIQSRPSVSDAAPAANPQRSTLASTTPQSPQQIERPRPQNRSPLDRGTAQLKPQPMAITKSTGGTAGVGRTANLSRDLGSRQSAAITPSDSQRRKSETSQAPGRNTLTLRQAARTPRTTAAALTPSSALRAQNVPIANRAAAQQNNELTASASAALTQSNTDATRGEISAERGTGNVDIGPTKIVSESLNRRVEGGGQPEIQSQPSEQRLARADDIGAATPSLDAMKVEMVDADVRTTTAGEQLADHASPTATADQLARAGGQSAVSGGPSKSQLDGSEPSTSTAMDLANSPIGQSDGEDEDEEEKLRRESEAIAQSIARSLDQGSPRSSDASAPSANLVADASATQSSTNAKGQGTTGQIADGAAELLRKASGRLPGSGLARATTGALAAAASSMPLIDSGGRRAERREATPGAQSQTPTTGGIAKSSEQQIPVAIAQSTAGQQPQGTGRETKPNGSSSNLNGQANQMQDADRIAELTREAPQGMSLEIDAKSGPAGVGNRMEPDPGIDSRRASRESPAIQSMTQTRFRKNEAGGTPSISPAPVIAKEAFRSRNNPSRQPAAPRTEESIELGLSFLAKHQQQDGSWTLSGFDNDENDRAVQLSSDTAATGLAMLAFQGAGYNHKEFKYAGQMEIAVRWMVDHQQPNGCLYLPSDKKSNGAAKLYSHGIAALALAEAYGMTQDETLRQPVQRALDYIAASQDRKLGGWRYRPGDGADTSVTGWMMMAMQSGKLAGLDTDDGTWQGIERWLQVARDAQQSHLFRYNPYAEDTPTIKRAHGRNPTACMTSVGLLMRLYLGWDRYDPRFVDGANFLLEHLPGDSSMTARDTYYWYYATQVLNHVGGEPWEKWHAALHPLLVRSQVKDGDMTGSWDPLKPVPDRWGAQAGRLYVTAMNLLSLEVDYRLLPLYDDTSGDPHDRTDDR